MDNIEKRWVLGNEYQYLITEHGSSIFTAEYIPVDDKPLLLLVTSGSDWYEAVRAVMDHMQKHHEKALAVAAEMNVRSEMLLDILAHIANYEQETLSRRNDEYDRRRPVMYARQELERLGYGDRLKGRRPKGDEPTRDARKILHEIWIAGGEKANRDLTHHSTDALHRLVRDGWLTMTLQQSGRYPVYVYRLTAKAEALF